MKLFSQLRGKNRGGGGGNQGGRGGDQGGSGGDQGGSGGDQGGSNDDEDNMPYKREKGKGNQNKGPSPRVIVETIARRIDQQLTECNATGIDKYMYIDS